MVSCCAVDKLDESAFHDVQVAISYFASHRFQFWRAFGERCFPYCPLRARRKINSVTITNSRQTAQKR